MIYGDLKYHVLDDQTDRIGIRTLTIWRMWQPLQQDIAPALLSSLAPERPEVEGGLDLIGRQNQKFRGGMRTIWTYEGIDGDGKSVTFKGRNNSPDYRFEPGFAQVSIFLHPNYRALRKKYQGQEFDGSVVFPDSLSNAGASAGSGLGLGGEKIGVSPLNPMHGVTDFFRLEGTYVFRYAATNTIGILGGISRIHATGSLPGKPPHFPGRDWLKLPPVVIHRGTIFDITETYWLSGENGWPKPVYSASGGESQRLTFVGASDLGTSGPLG